MRIRLDYTQEDGYLAGSRFYIAFTGTLPTSANCATLAGDVAAAWNTNLASLVDAAVSLTEVDVLDISTDSGNFGTWSGAHPGTDSGTSLPSQVATNVEFDIGRRYRGGKPRMFLPPATLTNAEDAGHWTSDYITAVNTGVAAFMAEIAALDIGAIGVLSHVNVSYYQGFTNVTNSSGRTRAAPKYRPTALLDPVTGYACKGRMGSQKRRRSATTF